MEMGIITGNFQNPLPNKTAFTSRNANRGLKSRNVCVQCFILISFSGSVGSKQNSAFFIKALFCFLSALFADQISVLKC